MDARAVQGDPGRPTGGVEALPLPGGRVEPAERGDDVLGGLEDPGDHRRVGHERAVDHAIGVGGQQCIDVAGRRDPDRAAPD
jgi:hypothetical protein